MTTNPPPENARQPQLTNPLTLIVWAAGAIWRSLLPIAVGLYSIRDKAPEMALFALIPIGFFLIALAYKWLIWRRYQYIVGEEDIRLEQGLLARSSRSVPYERIQDVSIEQKLVPRLLGLASVKFETGSGKGEEISLEYVRYDQAEALRELVRARAQGAIVSAQTGTIGASEAPELTPSHVIFRMSNQRILLMGLFNFSLVLIAILSGVVQQFGSFLPFDLFDPGFWTGIVHGDELKRMGISAIITGLAGLVITVSLLGIGSGVVMCFIKEYGFTLTRTEKGYRRQRGLFNKTDVVMPVHRVQAAKVESGWLRQRLGWYGLKFVSLAQDISGERSHVAAPFAHWQEIAPIIAETGMNLPEDDLIWRKPLLVGWIAPFLAKSSVLLAICWLSYGFTQNTICLLPVLLIPIWAISVWLGWRKSRHALDDEQIYVGHGWWSPSLTIMRREKVQSLKIMRGPLGRFFGYASLHFGMAGGTLHIRGIQISEANHLRKPILESVKKVDFSKLYDNSLTQISA